MLRNQEHLNISDKVLFLGGAMVPGMEEMHKRCSQVAIKLKRYAEVVTALWLEFDEKGTIQSMFVEHILCPRHFFKC